MDSMDPDLGRFRTAVAAFHSATPATDLGVPTRVRLLRDILYWNMCPSRDPACRVVVSFEIFGLQNMLDFDKCMLTVLGAQGDEATFVDLLSALVHYHVHGVD